MRSSEVVLIILFLPLVGWSQVNNDDCLSALFISDISNYCSPVNVFTNVNAEASVSPDASCWGTEDHEAAFAFALASRQAQTLASTIVCSC